MRMRHSSVRLIYWRSRGAISRLFSRKDKTKGQPTQASSPAAQPRKVMVSLMGSAAVKASAGAATVQDGIDRVCRVNQYGPCVCVCVCVCVRYLV